MWGSWVPSDRQAVLHGVLGVAAVGEIPTYDAAAACVPKIAVGVDGHVCDVVGVGVASWTGISVASKDDITLKAKNKYSGFKILAAPTQTMEGSSKVTAFKFNTCARIEISGLNFNGNSIDCNILGLSTVTDSIVRNNYFHDSGSATANGVFTENCSRNKYTENTF